MKKESFFAKLGRSFKSLFRSSVTGKKGNQRIGGRSDSVANAYDH